MSDEPIRLSSRQPIPPEYANWDLPDSIRAKAGNWQTMVFVGGPGSRKTTQLWTIRRVCSKRVHIMSEAMDIDMNRFSVEHIRAWSEFPGILCIDDVGYKKPNEWNLQVLYCILTHRRAHGLKTILTTNHNEAKIKELYDDRISSRMFSEPPINVGDDDYRKKVNASQWNKQHVSRKETP
jgi:hypothetical protein